MRNVYWLLLLALATSGCSGTPPPGDTEITPQDFKIVVSASLADSTLEGTFYFVGDHVVEPLDHDAYVVYDLRNMAWYDPEFDRPLTLTYAEKWGRESIRASEASAANHPDGPVKRWALAQIHPDFDVREHGDTLVFANPFTTYRITETQALAEDQAERFYAFTPMHVYRQAMVLHTTPFLQLAVMEELADRRLFPLSMEVERTLPDGTTVEAVQETRLEILQDKEKMAMRVVIDAPRADRQVRLMIQRGHPGGGIDAVAFSPDGRYVLTGGDVARLWEVATGREIRRLDVGMGDEEVYAVAFSPDGRQALTGSTTYEQRGIACLWGLTMGVELLRLETDTRWVSAVAFSPDGRHALTGGAGDAAQLWDLATGQEIGRLERHGGRVNTVLFSPDRQRALTGGDGMARLWDLATGRALRRYEGHSDGVESAAFAPDGHRLLTGGGDGTALLWDVDSGEELRRLQVQRGSVRAVAFLPDGSGALTGGGAARVWDLETGEEVQQFGTKGAHAMALSPDGRSVLTASNSSPIARLWDVATGKELRRFEGLMDQVNAVALSPDGRQAVVGGDGGALLWDLTTGRESRRFGEGKADTSDAVVQVYTVAISPDGRHALTGGGLFEGVAQLWDLATGQEIRRLERPRAVMAVAFSPDGQQALVGDEEVVLWELSTGKELHRFEIEGIAGSIAFTPDGLYALTGEVMGTGTARLWDLATGREKFQLGNRGMVEMGDARGHSILVGGVSSLAISPDGRSVLTGASDGAVLWDLSTGEPIRQLGGFDYINAVAISPDGQQALTVSRSGVARLWELPSGRELHRLQSEHVGSAVFSPDGRYILSGDHDRTVRLWRSDSGALIGQFVSFRDGTWAVVDAEGHYDASNGGDVEGLYGVVGLEPISLDQIKSRSYEPGLLVRLIHNNR